MLFEGIDYPYEIINRKRHEIGRIQVIQDTLRIDGKLYPYTFTKTRDSVCVFPVCGEDVVLIEQYRHSLNRWALEVPAGGIDAGEDGSRAARRELLEETGYIADDLVYMGQCWENEGVSASRCSLYFARCTERTQPKCEKTELIHTMSVPLTRFAELIRKGEFCQLTGLLLWYRLREEGLISYRGASF